MSAEAVRPQSKYTRVWLALMALMAVSVVAARLHLPVAAAGPLIFGAAFVKAILVGLYFMHLKGEHLLVVLAIFTALALFGILTVSLVPDLVPAFPA